MDRIGGRDDISIFVDLPQVAPLLPCADIFVFPTLEEGFGTVAIEASAAGLPVVTTDLPAVREAIAPSHRNYMFPPEDVGSSVRAVRSILEDPAAAAQLSADAKRWAPNFSVPAVARKLVEFYDSETRDFKPERIGVRLDFHPTAGRS
jgi:glycogen(starch) synthase